MKIEKSSQSAVEGPRTGITKELYCSKDFVKTRNGAGFVIRALFGSHGSIMTGEPATEAQWVAWMAWFDGKGIPTSRANREGMTTVPTEWPEDFDADAPVSDRHARIGPSHRSPIGPLKRFNPEQEPWLKNAKREGNIIPSREVDRCWQEHLRSHMLGTASGPLFPHRLSRDDQPISPERRRELADMLRDVVAKATLPVNERPAQPEAPKKPLTAEELAEAYRQRDAKNGPLRLSQAALEAFKGDTR